MFGDQLGLDGLGEQRPGARVTASPCRTGAQPVELQPADVADPRRELQAGEVEDPERGLVTKWPAVSVVCSAMARSVGLPKTDGVRRR